MKKTAIALSALVAASFFVSPSAKAQPQPRPTVIMVCNINGQLYNVDQNYSIYAQNGYYLGQLVAAPTPSGWVAVRTDGLRFPVFGCQ
jgi:hypothetical protein